MAVVEEGSKVEVDHIQRDSAFVGQYLIEIQRLTEQKSIGELRGNWRAVALAGSRQSTGSASAVGN